MERRIPRASEPHLPTLNDALRPLLAQGTPASSFRVRYENGAVVIEQNSFTGCDLQAIDAAVASAPEHTDKLEAKAEVDGWPLALRAALLTLAGYSGKTAAQFRADVKSKVDSLV
jgi:hypothetical protein